MDTWDQMTTWHLVLPPSRPSATHLMRISEFIGGVDRSAPVAVLGSTPELRDLLHELGFRQVEVLERNERFYHEMSAIRVYQNEERLIRGDWLETLPHLTGRFAIILSDLTMGNITYDERAQFYDLVSSALGRGGMFLDKVLTHPGPALSVDALVEKYSALPLNLLHVNHFSCEMLFCSELIDSEEMVDSSRFYALLQRRFGHERIRAFLGMAKLITPEGCRWYYGRRWDRLERDYCPGLARVAVEDDEPGSPYYRRLKLFALARE